MNCKLFKTVFSKRLGMLMAVGENTTGQGKAHGASSSAFSNLAVVQFVGISALSVGLSGLSWAQTVANNDLPTGATVAAGVASVGSSGAAMTIRQGTERAIINWQSFNIGKDATVSIVQPGSQSVLLNRVTGESPSQILGQLSANGQVVLVNPNGMTFGKDGSVSAASFTASTLGISDASFMSGDMRFERNGSRGQILNQGRIATHGGYVALLGANVSNEGRIETRGSAGLLGAAETIQIPLSGSGRVKLELTPAQINASVGNTKDGVIITEGGQVYMQAAAVNNALASITQSGSIDTSATAAGNVHLLADNGQIKVDGSITANSTGKDDQGQLRKGGDIIIGRDEETGELARSADVSGARLESQHGFVETSGHWLKSDGIKVQAADWLLDPYNITITSGTGGTSYSDPNLGGAYTYTPSATSSILASDIQNSLNNGTNVKISTGLSGSAGGDVGNITVASNITKSSGGAATLTLEANNNITINSGISITDSGMATRNLGVQLTANGASGTSSSNALLLRSNASVDVGGSVGVNVAKSTGGGLGAAAIYMTVGTLNAAQNNGGSRTFIRGGSVNVNMALSGTNTWGLFGEHATGVEATNGNLSITATYSGAGSTSGTGVFIGSGWNGFYAPAASYLKATNGGITVQSITAGTSADGGLVLSGTAVSATNDINLKAQLTDSTKTAINISSEWNSNPKINSFAGNLLFQSNKGAIRIASLTAGALTGTDIIIDNTGSALTRDASSSNYVKGAGGFTGATGASIGIAGSGTGIQATGSLDIIGVGSVAGSSGVTLTTTGLSGGRVSVQGENLGKGDGTTNGFYNTGAITSTTSDVYIKGITQKDNALSLQGAITGKTDVTLDAQAGDTSNTATSRGLYLNKAVTAQTGNINLTATSTSNSVVSAYLNTGASLVTNTSGKTIAVNADTLQVDTSATINAGSSGTVNLRPVTSGVGIDLGGSDVLTSGSNVLGLSGAELARITAGQLNIGSGAAGNMTVSSAVTTVDAAGHVALTTGGNLAINAALQSGTTATKNLTLNLTGSGSAMQTSALKTSGLELLGSNATYTLNNSANDAVTLAANTKTVGYTDATALTIGSVNSTTGITASGTVSVGTESGNLSVSQAVSTTDTSSSAIVLNAGISTAAGTATGGDLQLSGAYSFSTGIGGRTKLYTGNTSNTNLTSLVGSGSGRFRYNSDESTTNYSAALGSGIYAIYRESPVLTGTVNSASKTYNAEAYAGGNGISNLSGYTNGDSDAKLGGVLYTGTSQNAINAGTYVLGATVASALGYNVALTNSTLTVNKAALTASANSSNVTYNGSNQSVSGYTVSGLLGTDTVNDLSGLSASGATGKNAGTYTNTMTVVDQANYTVTGTNGSLVIGKANATVTANSATSTYNGANQTVSGFTATGLVGSETTAVLSGVSASRTEKNAGTYTTSASGIDSNYNLTFVDGSMVINRAQLAASLVGSISKTYDSTTNATLNNGNFNLTGFVAGEGASVSQTTGSYASANVDANGGNGAVSASLLASHLSANSGTLLSNYVLPTSASGNVGTITPAALTLKVNNATAFVTQDANTAVNNGYSYTGLQGTDTAATALNQAPTASDRTYTGSSTYPVVGSYSGVYGLGYTPTAQHGNYTITVQNGNLTVIPADQLLIHVGTQTDRYGNRTASTAGQAGSVSAQYCLVAGNCNGANLYTLTLSSSDGTHWSGTDNTNTTVQFDTTVASAGHLSQGGYLNAGNYNWGISNLSSSSTGQFNGSTVDSGTLTINRLSITPTANAVSKVYDGTASAAGVNLNTTQALVGDDVSAVAGSGSYSTKNVITNDTITFGNLSLQGADRDNYALALSSVQGTGDITAKAISLSGITADTKTYDGSNAASVSTATASFNGMVAGDNLTVSSSGTFNDKNVGTNKTVTLVNTLGGADLGNYTITDQGSTSADIGKASLVIAVVPRSVTFNGLVQSLASPEITGLMGGDSISIKGVAQGLLEGTYKSSLVASAGAGTDLNNYQITYHNASLVINPRSTSDLAHSKIYAGQIAQGGLVTRVSFSGLGGASLGADTAGSAVYKMQSTEACTPESGDQCVCEESKQPGVDLCIASSKQNVLAVNPSH